MCHVLVLLFTPVPLTFCLPQATAMPLSWRDSANDSGVEPPTTQPTTSPPLSVSTTSSMPFSTLSLLNLPNFQLASVPLSIGYFSDDCRSYAHCAQCALNSTCGWCPQLNECQTRNTGSCPPFLNFNGLIDDPSRCAACTGHDDCNECIGVGSCRSLHFLGSCRSSLYVVHVDATVEDLFLSKCWYHHRLSSLLFFCYE